MDLTNQNTNKVIGIKIREIGDLDQLPDKIEYSYANDTVYATGTWWDTPVGATKVRNVEILKVKIDRLESLVLDENQNPFDFERFCSANDIDTSITPAELIAKIVDSLNSIE